MNTVLEKQNTQKSKTIPDRTFVAPEVNIYETPEQYILQAEMPGVSRPGLEITLEGNTLTFVGRREEAVAGNVLYRETLSTDFRRVFELDPTIDTD